MQTHSLYNKALDGAKASNAKRMHPKLSGDRRLFPANVHSLRAVFIAVVVDVKLVEFEQEASALSHLAVTANGVVRAAGRYEDVAATLLALDTTKLRTTQPSVRHKIPPFFGWRGDNLVASPSFFSLPSCLAPLPLTHLVCSRSCCHDPGSIFLFHWHSSGLSEVECIR